MSFRSKLLCATLVAFIAGCDTADTPADGTPDGGTGGGGTPAGNSDLITFAIGNYESEIKFIGPRTHVIVGEVYRVLALLDAGTDENAGTSSAADAIIQKMIDANNVPTDPFVIHGCDNAAGVTSEYRDLDSNSVLSAGDEILRSYDNFTCEFEIVDGVTPRSQPKSLTGSLLFNFIAPTDATTSIYVGTATYTGYNHTDGLLKVTDASDAEVFNGTVEFNINLTTGNATFSNIAVTIDGGSGSLSSPIDFTIDQIIRTINDGGNDSVQIIGGSATSQVSNLQTTFATVNYNGNVDDDIIGPTGASPVQGALLFQGNNSATRIVSRPSGGATPAQLDDDGDGDFSEGVTVEPTNWAWAIGGFLMPGA